MVVVAEVAIGVTVLGFFLSPHITKLMDLSREWAGSEFTKYKLSKGNKDLLRKLVEDLDGIKSSLDPTSPAFVNEPIRLDRLWRLMDDIHDAVEVFDLFELQIKAASVVKKKKTTTKKKKSRGMKSKTSWLSDQLKKVLDNLEEAEKDLIRLHQVPESSIMTREETGPNPVRNKGSFFGYQDQYAQLVNMLWQQPDGNKVDGKMQLVIAIVGHAGMGKTELARQAYRAAKHKFDLDIWVHAYGKNTEFDLLKEIWKSGASEKPVGEMNVACLQRELEKLLESKRCLLVLDDVWNHESATSELERKQASLALDSFKLFAKNGSRIVMTTRAKICSTTFKADEIITLDGIKPKEVTDLLNHTVTDGTSGSTWIKKLLNDQVPNLKGSPLAAIEIGKALMKQTTSDKRCDILHNIKHQLGSVLQGHLFTYRHLPPHLQRCFEFCSIFPNGWSFEPEKLMKMWIAHGFVEDAREGPSMEDVARVYFDSLVDRSLFRKEGEPGRKEPTYVIHEQIHWMIRVASARNCMSISGNSTSDSTGAAARTSIPATVRHLSVTTSCLDKLEEYSIGLSNLRTLLVLKDDDDDPANLISAIDEDVLLQFKGVRVLDLTGTGITELPASIGKLKYVRFLGLPSTISSDLGDQVTKLMFLQTLSVGQGNNWKNRDRKRECITNISGIGMLVKLRESIVFEVKRGSEKGGHSLSELAGMNSLRGTLRILGLDAVANKEEAEQARLGDKCSVKVLKLEWRPPNAQQPAAADPAVAVAVLEGLKPHSYLHDLRITRYPGQTSPTWLSGLKKLTCLCIKNCRKLKALPALGELPYLELLDVMELPCVERIDGGFCGAGVFPELKKLVLDDMASLVAWDDMPKQAFPLLTEVSIVDCPRLSSLSGLDCCTGLLNRRVKGCPAITQETLPAALSTGKSTCKFH